MAIRPFAPGDEERCFRIRNAAFSVLFKNELLAETITACVNAYLPLDYLRMAKQTEMFVVENGGEVIGFFNLKQIDNNTIELALIYIDIQYLGRGYGRKCITYIESLLTSRQDVRQIVVETIIPSSNLSFYRKMGFGNPTDSFCLYPGKKVKSTRLTKPINQAV